MTLATLARWIESHGHAVRVDGDALVVGIEWWKPGTDEHGIEWGRVRTMAEARAVLGY